MSTKDKTIEVYYSNSFKINLGDYNQEGPFYGAKQILTINGSENEESVYNRTFGALKGIVEPLIQDHYNKKRRDTEKLRIRIINGIQMPSVTSILNPDGIQGVPKKKLDAHIAIGNRADQIFKTMATTGDTQPVFPTDDFSPLEWKLDITDFFEKYPFLAGAKGLTTDINCHHNIWRYSGEGDVLCMINKKLTILDVKTGQFKWEQVIAYAKALIDMGTEVKQVGIADLKNNELHLKSIGECQVFWEKFLVLRGVIQSRFGI